MRRLWLLVISSALLQRLILLQSSPSTDMEVHRNWMAITSSLPVSRWYTDNTSEWTLDYPPLFAWFEFVLSKLAPLFDANMLRVSAVEYTSPMTLVYLRLTVIVTEFLLWGAVIWHVAQTDRIKGGGRMGAVCVFTLTTFNAGLIMVDHVHFQYNGFLLGLLILSVSCMVQGHYVASAVLFAVVVNMKHLFAQLAPLYLVFLLRHYCRLGVAPIGFVLQRVLRLAGVVCGVCVVSVGPFVAHAQLPQLIARLFPFGRGLCHAYWAPNIWVFYNIVDILLAKVLPRAGMETWVDTSVTMTGGLVGAGAGHQVLPSVSPVACVLLTLALMSPALWVVWYAPRPRQIFVHVICLCGLAAFLCGYHVHEKAILTVTIPFTLLAADSEAACKLVLFLSLVAHSSLFPLLFRPMQGYIRVLCTYIHVCLTCGVLGLYKSGHISDMRLPHFPRVQQVCLAGLAVAEVYDMFLHPVLLASRAPFLPLMLRSIVCAVGVLVGTWELMVLTMHVATNRVDLGPSLDVACNPGAILLDSPSNKSSHSNGPNNSSNSNHSSNSNSANNHHHHNHHHSSNSNAKATSKGANTTSSTTKQHSPQHSGGAGAGGGGGQVPNNSAASTTKGSNSSKAAVAASGGSGSGNAGSGGGGGGGSGGGVQATRRGKVSSADGTKNAGLD